MAKGPVSIYGSDAGQVRLCTGYGTVRYGENVLYLLYCATLVQELGACKSPAAHALQHPPFEFVFGFLANLKSITCGPLSYCFT